MIIPGTHYTLHWFMQCKISDPAQIPEFKYVPIPTGASSLPFGTAPYVPTVQISQTKTDWVVIDQSPYLADAKKIVLCLAKCINTHNFTIFDARDLMASLDLSLPIISHEETVCELDFLERQRKGLVVSYSGRKRKFEMTDEYFCAKKSRTSSSSTSSVTRQLLAMLANGPVTSFHAAQQLRAPEELVEQVAEVLAVIGQVTVMNGTIRSTQILPSMSTHFSSPESPLHSIEDSFDNDRIPETPPQSMPMWDPVDPTDSFLSSTPSRPYATRSAGRKLKVEPDDSLFFSYHQTSLVPSCEAPRVPIQRDTQFEDRSWGHPSDALNLLSSTFSASRGLTSDMGFDSHLDLTDASDFFQSNFWEQY
jgi:hypothetical protein